MFVKNLWFPLFVALYLTKLIFLNIITEQIDII